MHTPLCLQGHLGPVLFVYFARGKKAENLALFSSHQLGLVSRLMGWLQAKERGEAPPDKARAALNEPASQPACQVSNPGEKKKRKKRAAQSSGLGWAGLGWKPGAFSGAPLD